MEQHSVGIDNVQAQGWLVEERAWCHVIVGIMGHT